MNRLHHVAHEPRRFGAFAIRVLAVPGDGSFWRSIRFSARVMLCISSPSQDPSAYIGASPATRSKLLRSRSGGISNVRNVDQNLSTRNAAPAFNLADVFLRDARVERQLDLTPPSHVSPVSQQCSQLRRGRFRTGAR